MAWCGWARAGFGRSHRSGSARQTSGSTGGLVLTGGFGATEIQLFGSRRVRDLSDLPIISPVLNSFLSQENGDDYGDYLLLDRAGAGVRHRLGARTTLALDLAVERSRSLDVTATPARGSLPAQPSPRGRDLPDGAVAARARRAAWRPAPMPPARLRWRWETDRPASFARRWTGHGALPLGATALAGSLHAGLGSDGLPAYRSFVLGGRGTLVGEPFRAYGGRSYALAELEWRVNVPAPSIPLGSFASTGRTMVIAPFLAAGWSDRAYAASRGSPPRACARWPAMAVEVFMRLIRLEAGVGLRDGDMGLTIDVHPDWWGLL